MVLTVGMATSMVYADGQTGLVPHVLPPSLPRRTATLAMRGKDRDVSSRVGGHLMLAHKTTLATALLRDVGTRRLVVASGSVEREPRTLRCGASKHSYVHTSTARDATSAANFHRHPADNWPTRAIARSIARNG